jgi:hypothetical protein
VLLQERLARSSMACDAGLAAAAASFFSRVIQESGSGLVGDNLLQAVAAYARDNCGQLSGEVGDGYGGWEVRGRWVLAKVLHLRR